jgi:hypothetical protein
MLSDEGELLLLIYFLFENRGNNPLLNAIDSYKKD